jgi:hypothetical protein
MSSAAEAHLTDAIARAALTEQPFPHLYLAPAFPGSFYRELLAALPEIGAYTPLGDTETLTVKGGYAERSVCRVRELEGRSAFWAELSGWIHGTAFAERVLDKFSAAFLERFGHDRKIEYEIDVRLVRDSTNYAIGPHTDAPQKLVSLLFYLPADESMSHLGTSLYVPRDPAFRCEGGPHYGFERFSRVATAAFRPNSMLGFPKLARSFHGVEGIVERGIERNLLLYNLYVRRLIKRMPERGAAPAFVAGPQRAAA